MSEDKPVTDRRVPRPYNLSDPAEVRRLVCETKGYMRISLNHGTDQEGRKYALLALKELGPILADRERMQKRIAELEVEKKNRERWLAEANELCRQNREERREYKLQMEEELCKKALLQARLATVERIAEGLAGALGDLIGLAEVAMREANNSFLGEGYEVEGELSNAQAALAAYAKATTHTTNDAKEPGNE